jgi:hypothetical protein
MVSRMAAAVTATKDVRRGMAMLPAKMMLAAMIAFAPPST